MKNRDQESVTKYIIIYICISYFTCTLVNKYLTYKSIAVWELLSDNLHSHYRFCMGTNIQRQQSLLFSAAYSWVRIISIRGERTWHDTNRRQHKDCVIPKLACGIQKANKCNLIAFFTLGCITRWKSKDLVKVKHSSTSYT